MSRNVEELRDAIAEFEGPCPVAFEGGFLHVKEDGGWHRIANLERRAVVEREAEERGEVPAPHGGNQVAPGIQRHNRVG